MQRKGGTAFQNKEENVLYKEHLTEEEELSRATVQPSPHSRSIHLAAFCSYEPYKHFTYPCLLLMHWLRAAEPHRAFLRHFILQKATAFLFKIPAFMSSCLEKTQKASTFPYTQEVASALRSAVNKVPRS